MKKSTQLTQGFLLLPPTLVGVSLFYLFETLWKYNTQVPVTPTLVSIGHVAVEHGDRKLYLLCQH